MKLKVHKGFKKDYQKLSSRQRKKVDQALRLFMEKPFEKSLRNHPLSGVLQGIRSISAGFDLRILYRELEEDHVEILLLKVGTHNQVYH